MSVAVILCRIDQDALVTRLDHSLFAIDSLRRLQVHNLTCQNLA